MLHSEEDKSSSLIQRGMGAMKKFCLITVALTTSLMFFNNLNLSEAGIARFTLGAPTAEASSLDVWWPVDGATMSGVQPFKFSFGQKNINSFEGYWQVGDGALNRMNSSRTTYPHKVADVDLLNWTWEEDNSYNITFIAQKKDGTELARETVRIVVKNAEAEKSGVQGSSESNEDEHEVVIPQANEELVNLIVESEEALAPTEVVAEQETEDDTSEDQAPSEDTPVEVGSPRLILEGPENGEVLSGLQTFQARIEGMNAGVTRAYWKVGDGNLNHMSVEDMNGYLAARADVDLVNWTWRTDGRYHITFVVVNDNGETLVEKTEIHVQQIPQEVNGELSGESPVSEIDEESAETVSPVSVEIIPVGSNNPLAGKELYRAPHSNAERQANEWRSSRPEDALLMDIMAREPQSMWIGGWGNTETDVRNRVREADARGEIAVFVAYNIPHRDCGLYSAGGADGATGYRNWIAGVARGIEGSNSPVVILEPDALAGADCLSETDKAERKQLIREAIVTLKNAGAIVYVEASSPPWKSPEEMAKRLAEIGVERADGFAMNTSSYTATNLSVGYGEEISRLLGGMHFVVDTSRSGQGQTADMQWCNPSGRGLGERPTTNTGNALVDAFMWIKSPGESDGTCNGGPSAGQWYPEQALELVKNRAF